jgi:hypothetical protein
MYSTSRGLERRAETSSAARFGFWAALATGLSTLVTFAFAIAPPPLSGQLCKEGCLSYPYLDIAVRFPRDYFWLFPAILATLLYLAVTIALYARVTSRGRLFAQLGLALSIMAALTLVGDYFVQLAVIQPSLRAGEADGISLLTQYNPPRPVHRARGARLSADESVPRLHDPGSVQIHSARTRHPLSGCAPMRNSALASHALPVTFGSMLGRRTQRSNVFAPLSRAYSSPLRRCLKNQPSEPAASQARSSSRR